jgi:predicted DNA-binding transcriptional regulator YafY
MSVKASQISFNEGVMRLAVIHRKQVEFRYEKNTDAPIETRRLIPSSLVESHAGSMSFFGYDPDRESDRQFRIDRIKGDVRFV